ncbi:hypothetical protein F5B22DRAFT_303818 [Xylaria bambusicola]|uniref:uncharacterized protein n=1 Tax=Xylaria bambusicola TaxID=326684 RepID=UPI002008DE44|nr:uncharacterized protein F5B22DRAFT_303818 [Xylaria bambusicola]KAI0512468.1 hypothetical protein F5B22DRAFT_303818 [Xylaria bambusicola]
MAKIPPKGILKQPKAKGKARLQPPHLIAYDEDEAPLPKPFDIDPKGLFNDGFEEGSRVKNFFGEYSDIQAGFAELFGSVPVFKPKPRPKASASGWGRLFRYDPFLSLLFSMIQEAGINFPPPDGFLDECIGYEVDYIRLAYTPYQQPRPFGKTLGLRPHPAPVRKGARGSYWYGIPAKEEEKEFPKKPERWDSFWSEASKFLFDAKTPKRSHSNMSKDTKSSGGEGESSRRSPKVSFVDLPDDSSMDWDTSTIGNDERSDQIDNTQQQATAEDATAQCLDPDLPFYGPLNFEEHLQAYLARRREQDEAREQAARDSIQLRGPGRHPNMITIEQMIREVKREKKLYWRAYQKTRKILRMIWERLK